MRSLASIVLLLLPVVAAAQPEAGQVRIAAATDLVGVTSFPDRATTGHLGPGLLVASSNDLPPGFGVDDLPESTTRGLTVEAAFLPTDRVVTGVQVRLGFSFVEAGPAVDPNTPGDRTVPSGALAIFAERLLTGGDVVPFVGLQAGLGAVFRPNSVFYEQLILGATGGVHLFALESLSVGFEVQLDYLFDSFRGRGGLEALLLVEVAGWL